VNLATDLQSRSEFLVREWNIRVDEVRETHSSLLLFGCCDDQQIVLKISRRFGDEWQTGRVLRAFDGATMVRSLKYIDGAVLLERIVPGNPLTDLVVASDDDAATDVLAALMASLNKTPPLDGCASVKDLAGGFDRYLQSDDTRIPRSLVIEARDTYRNLCQSQTDCRLLHGDLHHANVLWDARRGWVAIDPKGVIGEAEYEIGAVLRNPMEQPELFASSEIIERRIERFRTKLQLDLDRVRRWAFAQAVLSTIWEWEDDQLLSVSNSGKMLPDANHNSSHNLKCLYDLRVVRAPEVSRIATVEGHCR